MQTINVQYCAVIILTILYLLRCGNSPSTVSIGGFVSLIQAILFANVNFIRFEMYATLSSYSVV